MMGRATLIGLVPSAEIRAALAAAVYRPCPGAWDRGVSVGRHRLADEPRALWRCSLAMPAFANCDGLFVKRRAKGGGVEHG